MTKYVLVLVLLMVMAAIPTASALSVGEVQFDKMPLAPGESTDIWVEITNYGEDKSDIVILLDYHTVGLTGDSPAAEVIGILDGSSGIRELKKGKSNTLNYKIFVSPTAEEGIYNLDLISRYQTEAPQVLGNNTFIGSTDTISTVSVRVEDKKPHIMVSTSNTIFAPGSTGVVTLSLKNMGDALAEDTILEINPIPREEGDTGDSDLMGMLTEMVGFSMPSFSAGGSGEEIKEIPPFTVADTGTRFYIGDLKPRQSVDLKIKMAADPEITKGNYNIPITIRTKDSSTSEYVGVRVLSKADLIVPQTKTEPKELTPGVTAIYMVTVENIGQNDAKSTSVSIDSEYLSGRMLDYIGRIEAEDESTAMFEVGVVEDIPSSVSVLPVVINITYQDDTGEHLSIEKGEIQMKGSDEGSDNSNNSSNPGDFPLMGIGLALLFVLLIIFFIRRRGIGPFKKNTSDPAVNNYTVTYQGKEVMDNSEE